jgi:hypothetical protein
MGGSQVSRYPDDRGGPLLEEEEDEVALLLFLLLTRCFVVGFVFALDLDDIAAFVCRGVFVFALSGNTERKCRLLRAIL